MRNLKRVLSLALALVMVLGMMVIGTSAATYTDDAQIEYKEAVEVMTGIGLFEGNPDGTLAPKQVLTRAMAATILARIKLGNQVETLKATQKIFSDVAVNAWYAPAVQYCYNVGLIDGNGDGTFNPDGKLTGIAFAKLLLVAMGYDADEQGYVGKDWASNIAVDALKADLYISGVDITAELTREQAAQMILQVLDDNDEANMVYYLNSFDKATGKATIVGPLEANTTFRETYYKGLVKEGKGNEQAWGRPYYYQWTYEPAWYDDADTLYTKWEAPKAVYNTVVTECDVAAEIGMSYSVDLTWTFATYTNGTKGANTYIDAIDTVGTIGAQGRRTEVYSRTIVNIDTFLAKVTKVVPATFDAAGHQATYASRTIEYYGMDAQGQPATFTFTETQQRNYSEKEGQYLLINVSTKGAGNDAVDMGKYAARVLEIVGEPKTVVGAQTVIWKLSDKHTVAGVTYDDAFKYSLDNAGNKANEQFTWFFDQYGNVIGSKSIAPDADKFATIADIQWYNPAFQGGYAYATLVYADGSTEQVVVALLNGKELKYNFWQGNYGENEVSTNYGYNSEYIGQALFQVTKLGDKVVALTEVSTKDTGKTVAKGNPIMIAGAQGGYLDDNTQFLVRTGTPGKYVYTPVTGYNQIASLTDATVYYVNLDADWAAEIVYMYGAPTLSSSEKLVFLAGDAYSYNANATGVITHVTLQEVTINGVPTTVTVPVSFIETEIPDGIGYVYYMVDSDGDGKVDTYKWLGKQELSNGYTAELISAKGYVKLNNALQIPGTTVPFNTVGATVYGNWTGAENIVIVYKGAVVSAVYVVTTK